MHVVVRIWNIGKKTLGDNSMQRHNSTNRLISIFRSHMISTNATVRSNPELICNPRLAVYNPPVIIKLFHNPITLI